MAQIILPSAENQASVVELLLNMYLFGRKIKHQAKQNHTEHVKDKMLEFVILKLISESPRSVSELAQLLSTGLSAMSEKVKALKDRELLDQVVANDGREMRCQLTSAGKDQANQVKAKMLKTCTQFTQVLSEAEVSQLNNLMKKLVFTPQPDEIELQ